MLIINTIIILLGALIQFINMNQPNIAIYSIFLASAYSLNKNYYENNNNNNNKIKTHLRTRNINETSIATANKHMNLLNNNETYNLYNINLHPTYVIEAHIRRI